MKRYSLFVVPVVPVVLVVFVVLVVGVRLPAQDTAVNIARAVRDKDGFLVHVVASPYQAGKTRIRVLLPETRAARPLRVVYILPVEARDGVAWGDGLREVKRHNLHNKHGVVAVAPTFSHLPWYCDHAVKTEVRQESYFLRIVVPFVEKTYPVSKKRDDRLLLGFSKSGWGAYTLLLRHPDRFGRAAAWDAPLMMARPNKYGMGPVFGSEDNFAKYCVASMITCRAEELRASARARLVLLGFDNFRAHHQRLHARLNELRIPHVYRDGPKRRHHWETGWLSEALLLLLAEEESRNSANHNDPKEKPVKQE